MSPGEDAGRADTGEYRADRGRCRAASCSAGTGLSTAGWSTLPPGSFLSLVAALARRGRPRSPAAAGRRLAAVLQLGEIRHLALAHLLHESLHLLAREQELV